MGAGPRLVVATTNPNKLREIRGIMAGLGVSVDGLEAFAPVAEPDETGTTFAENARQKAVYYSTALGVPVVAEDSGLEIDALGGEPGVHSARYGGPGAATYAQKFELIYESLRARGAMGSPARFVCELAVADGTRILFEARGTVEGRVHGVPAGDGGFGYDPIFFYPPEGRTLGEVGDEIKRAVSHRGAAFRRLRRWLEDTFPLT
jgi:non-canonical purine NTP pyrophosphatase (RdgB/HAM1 family)